MGDSNEIVSTYERERKTYLGNDEYGIEVEIVAVYKDGRREVIDSYIKKRWIEYDDDDDDDYEYNPLIGGERSSNSLLG